MKKISELDTEEVHSLNDIRDKLNEVIQVVNRLRCVEEEKPILEKILPGECLIISKDEEGCIVARNSGGEVSLERVKESEKT